MTNDLGRIPTLADWLICIKPARWMSPNIKRQIAAVLGENVYAPPDEATRKQALVAAAHLPGGEGQ